MRSLGTRRVATAAGAAMAAVIALGGCSAGQVAETALLKSPVSGLNTQSPDGSLLVRNLQVVYNGPQGYPANSAAPLEVSLFNQTEQPMTVTISSKPQQNVVAGTVSAQQVGVGPVAPADASAAPAAPALQPAKFTIAPLGSETFLTGDTPTLQAVGLTDKLVPGYNLSLTIEVSTGSTPIEVLAPFAIPTSPASRAPGNKDENTEE